MMSSYQTLQFVIDKNGNKLEAGDRVGYIDINNRGKERLGTVIKVGRGARRWTKYGTENSNYLVPSVYVKWDTMSRPGWVWADNAHRVLGG
jgi:hypothetical protein